MFKKSFLLIFSLIVLFSTFSMATTQGVTNSADWKFVYTSALYSKIADMRNDFLISAVSAPDVLKTLDRNEEGVTIFESNKNAIISNYKSEVERAGFKVKEVILADDGDALAFELAKKSQATSFIIVDGTYGYPAILVSAYAVKTKSAVLFADKTDLKKLQEFLKERKAKEVIVFGHTIKQAVLNALQDLNPTILKGEDRFDDNFIILRRLKEKTGQSLEGPIITDGTFFETSLIGTAPVLLIGSGVSSQKVKEFIENEKITTATLVGPQLIDSARNIKQTTGLKNIFLRFGKTTVERNTGFSQPQALDTILLPSVIFNVELQSVSYNSLSKEMELTFKSNGNIDTVIKASGDVFIEASRIGGFSSVAPSIILASDTLSITYPVDFSIEPGSRKIRTTILLSYGESASALDISKTLEFENVSIVTFNDNSAISIEAVTYDKSLQRFEVSIKNQGSEAVYVKPSIAIKLAGDPFTVSINTPTQILGGASTSIPLPRTLSESDVETLSSTPVKVITRFGKRENVLSKTKSQDSLVEIRSGFTLAGIDVLPFAIAIIVLAALIFGGRKLLKLFRLD